MRTILRNTIERFPFLAQIYRTLRDQLDRHKPSIQTPWGFTLAGHEEMAKGCFEPEETEVVRALLREVDVLVNVGANIGYYCCHALAMGKKVIAVEPIARNLHYLLMNIRNNGWSKMVEVFPVAVGEQTDLLEMWGGGTGASLIKGWAGISENYVTQVPVHTLDRILGGALNGRKALIIVDVEGAEYMMLRGAEVTLQIVPAPIWMMEISATTHQPQGVSINPHLEDTFNAFFSKGYRATSVERDNREVTFLNVRDWSNRKVSQPTHNFIFRK
ncbi:FkbM family methyltransferase [Chlorobium sp. KB01]|uniref:FkbM family methyltransferase n=1 Tax=Chlorobium sp. KB01 TaxID=1917528 RepID=UPI0009FA3706|nr:FkbM family methyltransferase [Chlorobium sp. KB01]